VITAPVVVFEVLSPTTASIDVGVKNEEYRDTLSIRRYVMLAQDGPRATVFVRDGGDWVGHIISGDAMLPMPEIGIEVPLSEIYEGVDFAAAATAAPS
jgi:Uma2 family endonuclease